MNAKHPKQIPTPPFCKDCASFIEESHADNATGDTPRCRRFPMLDLVMGEKFFIACVAVRSPEAPCGETGKLFTPKEVLEKPVSPTPPSVEPDKTNLN
jgi:hypothetical protein